MSSRLRLDSVGQANTSASRLRGAYLAVVTANTDKGQDSRHRVKVRFPWLPDGDESYWARILAPMAGAERGTYFLPEMGDQVLVVFEHGDISRPIIVGGLWSQAQKPPERNDDGKNNIKVIKSKSGHKLIFDDTAGRERIVVEERTGRNRIVFDSAGDSLSIESGGDIELLAPSGTVRLSGRTVSLRPSDRLSSTAQRLSLSSRTLKVVSRGALELKGGSVGLNNPLPMATVPATLEAEEMRDDGREVEVAEGAVDPAGSPSARADASDQHLPDEAPPAAMVGASAGGGEVKPGQPVTVTATVDGAESATYEVEDADTGEVIDRGPAQVEGGRATATWDSRSLDRHPQTSTVNIRMRSGGASTQTGALPVAGRSHTTGAESPSNRLIDPQQPMPVADHRGGAVAGRPSVADHRDGPVTVAPTVDHRGRAADTGAVPSVDHRGGGAAAGVRDQRGAVPGESSVRDQRGAVPGESSVRDRRGDVSQAEGSASAAASGNVGGGAKVGSAASATMDGDGAAAAGAVGGAQLGAAVAGDASGAAGGGSAGQMVDGDVKGAAVSEGHVDSRAARMDSSDDVQHEVEGESVSQGKERSGVAAGEREVQHQQTAAERQKRDVEYQADVEGRARSEVSVKESELKSEEYRAERQVHDVRAQGDVQARADGEVNLKESEVRSEQYRAEREARQPQYEAEGAKYQAESRTTDARDPEHALDRESSNQVHDRKSDAGLNEAERTADDAERGSSDPRGASRHRVKKLDDDNR